jgi:hypothetical protein
MWKKKIIFKGKFFLKQFGVENTKLSSGYAYFCLLLA